MTAPEKITKFTDERCKGMTTEQRDVIEQQVYNLMEHWVRRHAIAMSPSDFAFYAQGMYLVKVEAAEIAWAVFR